MHAYEYLYGHVEVTSSKKYTTFVFCDDFVSREVEPSTTAMLSCLHGCAFAPTAHSFLSSFAGGCRGHRRSSRSGRFISRSRRTPSPRCAIRLFEFDFA